MAKVTYKLELAYFYGKEKETFSFFRLPKLLFSEERFKKLSTDAKVLYSFMLDRVALSIASNWRDKEGRVYIIYTNEEAKINLGVSQRTITSVMKELRDEGLLERKRQGLGKPDLLFVKNFASVLETTDKEENTVEKVVENESKITPLTGKTSGKLPEVAENFSTISAETKEESVPEEQDLPVKSSKDCVSRVANIATLDVQNLPPIKTDITNTDQTKTDFIKPTFPPNPTPTFPQSPPTVETGGEDWRDKEEIIDFVENELDKAYQQGKEELSYFLFNLRNQKSLMETGIYLLTGMEESECQAEYYEEYSKENFFFRTKKLYASALLDMLTSNKPTTVKGACISYAKVLEKLLEHITYDEYACTVKLDSIMDCTISAYIQANKESKIKLPVQYMKACIWSTLCEGTIRNEAGFHRLYG
ncbi:MAG: replication initiator protein A [Eubacteriales bacterium]